MTANLVQYYGTGRRKTATARVFLRRGSGRSTINRREFDEYFKRENHRIDIVRALTLTENNGNFDLLITVRGGGETGQAGAARLGIARALLEVNPEYRGVLKPHGLLTRDAREVERKKYGRAGARRRFQFSKR
jgi:small subunit ribosomal protein S9